jgi:hypothetical protein
LLLPPQVREFTLFACLEVLVPVCDMVCDPFPHIDIRARVNGVDVLHVVGVVHADDLVSVYLETDSDVSLHWEQVVNVDDIVLASGQEESIVGGESDGCYVGGVTVLVLLYQHEWLKCAIQAWGSVDYKAEVLGDGKELPVWAELGSNHNALKVKLSNGEVPF